MTTSVFSSGFSSAAITKLTVETAIGYVPKPEDINLEGLKDFDEEKLASILKVDNAKWAKEAAGVEEFYKKFGDKLPQELRDELNGLEERTKA